VEAHAEKAAIEAKRVIDGGNIFVGTTYAFVWIGNILLTAEQYP